MKKIFVILICGIIVLSLKATNVNAVPNPCIIFPDQCPESVDLGGYSFGTAMLLVSSTYSELEVAGDTDFFHVEFSTTTEASITSTGNLDLKASLYLESSPANIISSDVSKDGIDDNFHLDVYTFIANTEYIIVVESILSSQTGSYSVHIDYGGKSFDDPITWDVENESSINASIDYPGDKDYFKVVYTKEYDISFHSDSSTDLKGEISKTDVGHTLIASDSDSFDNYNFLLDSITLNANDVSIVSVEAESTGNTGEYLLINNECGCRNPAILLVSPLLTRVYDIAGNAHYQAETKYITDFENAVIKWNSLNLFEISKDTAWTINDLLVWDQNSSASYKAIYYPWPGFEDVLQFNPSVLDTYPAGTSYTTALHELGHGVGLLDFNESNNIFISEDEAESNIMAYSYIPRTEFGACDLQVIDIAYFLGIN